MFQHEEFNRTRRKNDLPQPTKRHLRPEARPILYRELDIAQQDAFRRILGLINEAIRDLKSLGEAGIRADNGHATWFHDDRSSRLAFLSGARGTGKTTVLLSLAKELENYRLERPQPDSYNSLMQTRELERYREAATEIQNSTVSATSAETIYRQKKTEFEAHAPHRGGRRAQAGRLDSLVFACRVRQQLDYCHSAGVRLALRPH